MTILKLFLGTFLAFSIVLFIAQFVSIDVSHEEGFFSKLSFLFGSINWLVVFGVSTVTALLAALMGSLRYTPIAKILNTRDDE